MRNREKGVIITELAARLAILAILATIVCFYGCASPENQPDLPACAEDLGCEPADAAPDLSLPCNSNPPLVAAHLTLTEEEALASGVTPIHQYHLPDTVPTRVLRLDQGLYEIQMPIFQIDCGNVQISPREEEGVSCVLKKSGFEKRGATLVACFSTFNGARRDAPFNLVYFR